MRFSKNGNVLKSLAEILSYLSLPGVVNEKVKKIKVKQKLPINIRCIMFKGRG